MVVVLYIKFYIFKINILSTDINVNIDIINIKIHSDFEIRSEEFYIKKKNFLL